jgi:uncharacterized protein (TIGR03083 family)
MTHSDHLAAYLAVRDRVSDVVAAHGEEPVPTCPGWAVRDVVAHLAGLCEDWVEGRLADYASDAWTAAQFARFDRLDVPEILQRWSAAATRFAALDDDPMMGPPARWAFGDAITHEADLRGALSAAHVPQDAVLLALKGAIARWRQVLHDAGAPTLLLRATDARDWWLGQPDDLAAVIVETQAYDVFRALAGRRSVDQVRDWAWSRDPEPFLAAGLPYPFRWASTDIDE